METLSGSSYWRRANDGAELSGNARTGTKNLNMRQTHRRKSNVAGNSWKLEVAMTATPLDTPKQAGRRQTLERLKGDTLGFRGPWGTTYATNLRLSNRQNNRRPMAQVQEKSNDPSSNAVV